MNDNVRRLWAVACEVPWRRKVVVSGVIVASIFGLEGSFKQ